MAKFKDRLFFIVTRWNDTDEWEYALDSQLRPTCYKSLEQLKKYSYKFTRGEREYKIVEYKTNGELISFDNVESLEKEK